MDRISILRRLPKRLVWCIYCACVIMGISAFYTFYSSNKKTTDHRIFTRNGLDSNLEPLSTNIESASTSISEGNVDSKENVDDVAKNNEVNSRLFGLNKGLKSVSEASTKTASSRHLPNQIVVTDSKLNNKERTKKSNASKTVIEDSTTSKKNSKVKPNSSQTNYRKMADTKYIYLTSAAESSTSTTTVPPPITTTFCNRTTKTILVWTAFFDYWDYFPQERFDHCPSCRNCHVTRDRTRLNQSDVIIFHCRDMSLTDLPPSRSQQQQWAFFCLESPPYSDFPGLQYMQNMFNLTLTYRRDSDVITQYGSVIRVRPPRSVDFLALRHTFLNKTRQVAWLSSHCPTEGGRDKYVAKLKKYIDVDVYGECGDHVCPKGHTDDCMRDFAKKYKFFLAFENTICQDYVTEKFYRSLLFNMVPVVFGGAKYRDIAPPTSYIDALSFKSPKHLAYFLSGVGSDFEVYNKYFRWRRDFDVKLANTKECDLCDLVNRSEKKAFSYSDMREWWVKDSKCRSWG